MVMKKGGIYFTSVFCLALHYFNTSCMSVNFLNIALANGHNGSILMFFSRAISTILYSNCLPTPLPLNDGSTSV